MSHPWEDYLKSILMPGQKIDLKISQNQKSFWFEIGSSCVQEHLLTHRTEFKGLQKKPEMIDVDPRSSPTLPPDERKMLETLLEVLHNGGTLGRK